MNLSRREFLKKSSLIAGMAALGSQVVSLGSVAAEASRAQGSVKQVATAVSEDVLIPSTDVMCVNFCGIRVRRVNGVIRAIYGNPASPYNAGHLCPKGQSGLFDVYNPYRIKAPLKRTNPDKSPDADPKWREISWEEAFEEAARMIKEAMDYDPRSITFLWGHGKYLVQDKFLKAFINEAIGSPNNVHRTTVCEAARHVADELTWGGHGFLPDLEYTEYYLNMGANFTEAEQWARWLDRVCMKRVVEDGMKLVVIEPRLSNLAAKATEWIPIKPGSDVVFLLAMARELIAQGYVDEEFLKEYTDAVYLVGEDGKFLRDEDGNPLVWDRKAKKAVPYDEAEEILLDGRVTVDGKEYRTSFRVFKDYLFQNVDLGEAEEITGIPAETIMRVAKEFGEHARIGSTIELEGKKLRYRPVAIHTFRGMSAREYGTQNWRAALMVQMLVGNFDAVGGLMLHKANPDYKNMKPGKCEYPPSKVDLSESVFYPHGTHNVAQQPHLTYLEPEKYGLPYKPKLQIVYATNRLFSTSDVEKQIEGAKKVKQIAIDIVLSEQTQMSDLVLPNKSYLECWHFSPTRWTPGTSHSAIRQPIVNAYNLPHQDFDILMILADKAGILDRYIEGMHKKWKFKKGEFNPLRSRYQELKAKNGGSLAGKKDAEELSRLSVKILWEKKTGKPFDYALKHGLVAKTVDVEHRYLKDAEKFRGKGKPKMHFYAEQLVHTREKVLEIMSRESRVRRVFEEWYEASGDELKKLIEIKLSPFPRKEHALPTPHRKAKEYPLYLITYKRMYRNQANPDALNPVLNEVAHDSGYNYVLINPAKAKELGIKDDDEVWIESRIGKVKARAKLSEGIRPDTVAVSYHYGRFARSFPEYARKGTAINLVLELHPDMISGHNSFLDTKVKVYRA
ncbi:molybdopterin-dependent oxidoreductase [Candidatus Pyrohabitans sp.]